MPSPCSLIRSVYRAITGLPRFLGRLRRTSVAVAEYQRLYLLSDRELAARGLNRAELGQRVLLKA